MITQPDREEHAPGASTSAAYAPEHDPLVAGYPLDDELVLYNSRDGEAYTLNGTGLFIWQCCDGKRSMEEIARALAVNHGIKAPRARAEVCAFLADLERARLLTWHDGDDHARQKRASEGRGAREALHFLALTEAE